VGEPRGSNGRPASGSSASATATASNEARLLLCGIRPKAVTNTPATEPRVLMKNTRPAPASARLFCCGSAAAACRRRATNSGFIAAVATSGAGSKIAQAAKAPITRSPRASCANTYG